MLFLCHDQSNFKCPVISFKTFSYSGPKAQTVLLPGST